MYMNNNTNPQSNTVEHAALVDRVAELEELVYELMDRMDDQEDALVSGEADLEINSLRCKSIRVTDGSAAFPIGLEQIDGDSFLALPGGLSGSMLIFSAERDGAGRVMATDLEGHVRVAMAYLPSTGCVFPTADQRLLGDEGPMYDELRVLPKLLGKPESCPEVTDRMNGFTG